MPLLSFRARVYCDPVIRGKGRKPREHASSPKYIFAERGAGFRMGQLETADAVSSLMFSQISKAQFRPMQD